MSEMGAMSWDEFGKKAGMFLNSAYKGVAGESISQYVGTGRVTNIFGRDQKFVFDWKYLLGSFPMNNPKMGFIFNGGTSSINLGANHSINFGGVHLLTAKVGYIGAKITVEIQKPDEPTPAYNEKYFLPHLIAYGIGLASVAVFVVCLLRWDDFTTNPEKIENWGKSIDSCKFAVVTGSFVVIDILYNWIIYILQEIGKVDAILAKLASDHLKEVAEGNLDGRFLAVEAKRSELESSLQAQISDLMDKAEKQLKNAISTAEKNIDDIKRYEMLYI